VQQLARAVDQLREHLAMFAAQDATALALADGHRFNSLTAFSRCSTVRV
jgi:hypothetical protein